MQGLNAIHREVLANAAQAMVGMVKPRLARPRGRAPRAEGAGDRAHHVRRHDALRAAGHGAAQGSNYDCLVFHATGVGGQAMEELVESRLLIGVIDVVDDGNLRS